MTVARLLYRLTGFGLFCLKRSLLAYSNSIRIGEIEILRGTFNIALSRPVLFPLEEGAIFLDFSLTDSSPKDGMLMLNLNADVNEAESRLMKLIIAGSGLQGV